MSDHEVVTVQEAGPDTYTLSEIQRMTGRSFSTVARYARILAVPLILVKSKFDPHKTAHAVTSQEDFIALKTAIDNAPRHHVRTRAEIAADKAALKAARAEREAKRLAKEERSNRPRQAGRAFPLPPAFAAPPAFAPVTLPLPIPTVPALHGAAYAQLIRLAESYEAKARVLRETAAQIGKE